MKIGMNSLANLAQIRKDMKRQRVSSYDKTGANMDNIQLKPNENYQICDIQLDMISLTQYKLVLMIWNHAL